MKSGANRCQGDVNLSNNLKKGTTSWSNRSLSQSGGEVERGIGFSEVNPCKIYNPFDILLLEGLVNDPAGSNDANKANISRLGRGKLRGICSRQHGTSRV